MSGIVRFDLDRGWVTLRDQSGAGDERSARALVPVDALAALLQQASSDGLQDAAYRIGTDLGRRVRDALGHQLQNADTQTVLNCLGGELALLGFGSLKLELWGRAMVLAIDGCPLLEVIAGDGEDAASRFLATLIEGAIARGLGRDAKLLALSRDPHGLRLLLCNAAAHDRVQSWLKDGCHYGEALARLNDTGVRA